MKPTLHVVGLPHTIPTPEFSWCAYTQKTRRFVEMMESLGYEVNAIFGEDMKGYIPQFSANAPEWRKFNATCAAKIAERSKPGDYLCISSGLAQEILTKIFPELIAVEHGVGYGGVFTPYCVFESYAWMHCVYGANAQRKGNVHDADGRFYDAVIPNSFHPAEFPEGDGKGNYLCYIGRLIERKGVKIAVEVAKKLGAQLKVAGSGDKTLLEGYDHVEYLGTLPTSRISEIMGGAICTLVPTQYVEPFGGVAAESMLTGTPVVTTDWGAFTETVYHGTTGYRCRTLRQFCDGVRNAANLDRKRVRQLAMERFSTEVTKHQYDHWFNMLETLKGKGWYA